MPFFSFSTQLLFIELFCAWVSWHSHCQLFVLCWRLNRVGLRCAENAPAGFLTCVRSRARAAVLAVVAALVDLAALAGVARLAAALGHLAGVEEAAAAVQALQVTGPAGRS